MLLRAFNRLHEMSYSVAAEQYRLRSGLLEDVRRRIFNSVIKGEALSGQEEKVIGPEFLSVKGIQPLSQEASILMWERVWR